MSKKLKEEVIKLAYNKPGLRSELLPLIQKHTKTASFEEDWGDKEVKKPSTGNKVKLKSLLKSDDPKDKEQVKKLREKYKEQNEDDDSGGDDGDDGDDSSGGEGDAPEFAQKAREKVKEKGAENMNLQDTMNAVTEEDYEGLKDLSEGDKAEMDIPGTDASVTVEHDGDSMKWEIEDEDGKTEMESRIVN